MILKVDNFDVEQIINKKARAQDSKFFLRAR
jgi:hypothetical protein